MSRKQLGTVLSIVFFIALIMGPGPGNHLINPDPADTDARRFFLGIPIVYAWAALWFVVQATCVTVAYFKLWRNDGSDEVEPEP